MTDSIRLDNDEKYELMIRIFNTKTKEVVREWRESCMLPNSKHVVKNAARKNGCYKVGKDLIRHSYAKLVQTEVRIQLDNDADNSASRKNIYVIADDKCLHIKYSADYDECGERNEYWGGVLAVQGDSWIDVNSVTDIELIEVLDSDGYEDDSLSYTMTADDRLLIAEVIKNFIEGNIEASQPANSYYFA